MKKNFHGIKRPAQSLPKKPKPQKFPMQVAFMKYVKNGHFVMAVLYDNDKLRILKDYEEIHDKFGRWIYVSKHYAYNDKDAFCPKIVTEKEIKNMGWSLAEIIPLDKNSSF